MNARRTAARCCPSPMSSRLWRDPPDASSARGRNPSQDIPENAGQYLKRLRAVVLVVSRGHHDNEIELRDDANRLPASTKRANPVDLTSINQGATALSPRSPPS